jgi:hypothetical protein
MSEDFMILLSVSRRMLGRCLETDHFKSVQVTSHSAITTVLQYHSTLSQIVLFSNIKIRLQGSRIMDLDWSRCLLHRALLQFAERTLKRDEMLSECKNAHFVTEHKYSVVSAS